MPLLIEEPIHRQPKSDTIWQFHGSQSPIRLLRVSRCLVKSYIFFNMVQPIDLLFCNMVEIIEQNIFNHPDFLFRS